MAVVLALTLFFAGVAGRAKSRWSQWVLFGAAVVSFLGAAVVLVLLPKTF